MYKKLALIWLFCFAFVQQPFCLEQAWNSQRSSHFIVYYKDAPEDFINEVIDAAEEYYRSITSNLGFTRYDSWSWEERAAIYIYNDKEDYISATKQPEWSGGSTAYQQKKISTFLLDSGFFDTLLPHEMGHIILREFVGYKADLPLWFEEGVASFQEKARRFGAARIVKEALLKKKIIPLADLGKPNLISRDKDFVDLFYAESASVVNFILTKFNKQNFVDLCQALKEGKSFDRALHEGYPRFSNLEELNRQWLRYLENE